MQLKAGVATSHYTLHSYKINETNIKLDNYVDRLWVEPVGEIIVARIKGEPTLALLTLRHQRIMQIWQETGSTRLLLDDLQMAAPTYEQLSFQRELSVNLDAHAFKIAVLVPNSQMAYLARLKFDKENHKVFYNQMVDAVAWLAS